MTKEKLSITLNGKLLKWIKTQIENKRFASVSHAIEYCVNEVMQKEKAS